MEYIIDNEYRQLEPNRKSFQCKRVVLPVYEFPL